MSRNWKIPLEGDPELTTLLTHAPLARTNICLQSEDFGTTWSAVGLQGIAETNQVAAPDGSLTADRLVDNSAGGSGVALLYQALSVEAATAYTISVYAKADQLNWLRLKVGDMAAADVQTYFNLDTGVLGGSGAGNVDQGIVDVGNGWYRCWISFVSDAVDTAIGFEVWVATADGVGTVDLDGTSSIYVWGAQLETGAAVTPYIPTTTAARTINTRTNLCLQSEDFSTTWVEANGASTFNQTTAPDGALTADKLLDNSATGTGAVTVTQSITLDTSTAYTVSVYFKKDQLDWAAILVPDFGALSILCYYDLTNGAIGATLGADNDDQGIEDVGDGWYRCWIAFTSDVADTSGKIKLYVAEADGDVIVDLDGTSSIFLWGAQLEESSAPTNYIPTTTAPVAVTGYSPRGSLVDDMHQALETVLEVEGNINDLWKRYKQLN